MQEGNQLQAKNIHELDKSETSFTAPYRHQGYKKALYALRDALDNHSAVILKGVEGTGKTTLVSELVSDYQHKGVPVVEFHSALTKPSQFYSKLADSLGVPKQKKDLIQALRDTKEAGQYCLVVIDQEAIHSSTEVTDTLKQLCLTSETTAGAIKLVVIRKDYLVIHTEKTPEADFHNWIKSEVTLDPLHIDDIEGYIYYLSAIKGLPPTPYEIGTDFLMIEQTEGRISRLKALLLPLIHKDVITRKDFIGNERNNKPLASNHSGIIALAFAAILALGVGIKHFLFNSEPSAPTTTAVQTPPPAVFADPVPTASGKNSAVDLSVTPPQTSKGGVPKENIAQVSTPGDSRLTDQNLPTLAQENEVIATDGLNREPANNKTNAVTATDSSLPSITTQHSNALSPQSNDAFQTEVKVKLLELETELSEAMIENNRLQIALIEAQNEQEAKASNVSTDTEGKDKFIAAVETAVKLNNADETPSANKNSRTHKVSEEQPTTESSEPEKVLMPTDLVADTQHMPTEVVTQEPVQQVASKSSGPMVATPKENTPLAETIALIDRWQTAWQAQNHEDYTLTYTAAFNGAYKTHQRWLKKRYDALTSPDWIKLARSELTNITLSESRVTVDFWINYEAANGYKDKTLKRLTIVNTDGEWLISKEQNLEVQPSF